MQGGSILKYLTDRIALQDTKISMEDLLFMRVIGRGGFGVVKMACARRTRTRYALKCLRKRHIVEHEQQQELQNERSILAEVDHPFIIKYVRSFRSDTQVYLLTELVTGGELLDVLDVLGLLGRSQAQFYTGSLVLALEFLHARRIAYLDLKSENCMIDHQGYLKMIDFGIAQRITSGKCYNVKGTPMFMAPEMILAKGYTTAADLWSLGINLYEYMVGEFPFAKNSTNHAEIFKAVLKDPLRFPQWFKNQECSEDCQSFMKSLLTRDPTRRLGVGGYDALKQHSFWKDFSFDRLLARQIEPPFLPKGESYVEGDHEHVSADGSFRSLVDEEASSMAPEDDGWRDPQPGWDDDFA
jgi:cGMP-dependent protein kinase